MKTSHVLCARMFAVLLAVMIPAGRLFADDSTNLVQESRWLPWDKGSLKFGGFVAAFDSTLAFGLNKVGGVNLNAEELLGLDSTLTVFRADAMFRPGESRRNQLDFTYAGYHRDASKTLTEDVIIDGVTYTAGAKVGTTFNFDIIRGTYTYAFLQDERMRIAAGLGVYAVPLKYGLEIETTGGRTKVEGSDTTLPLPALAFRAEFQLIPKLYLNASIEAMYLQINDFKGSLLDVNVAVEYRIWKHFGLGLGYSAMAVDVESKNDSSNYPGADFVGKVGVHFSGLMLYGKLAF